jgi:hypothetical protein
MTLRAFGALPANVNVGLGVPYLRSATIRGRSFIPRLLWELSFASRARVAAYSATPIRAV